MWSAVVESEKASFEVEAFSSGIVIDLPYREGDVATVLQPPHASRESGRNRRPCRARVSPRSNGAKPPSVAVAESAAPTQRSGGLRASPVARLALPAEFGREIASIAGTGPDGAVVLRDVRGRRSKSLRRRPPSSGAIALRELSAGDGAPVVFLHGFGERPLRLAPAGRSDKSADCRCSALDLPGHGSSAGHDATEFDAIVTAVWQGTRSPGRTDPPCRPLPRGRRSRPPLTARGKPRHPLALANFRPSGSARR